MIGHNGSKRPTSEPLRRSAGEVVRDVAALAELQIELMKIDGREAARAVARPLGVLAAAALLVVVALPLVLVALAEWLVASAGLSRAAGYGIVAAASLAIAAIAAEAARRRLKNRPSAFRRSQDELARNIAWIKNALSGSASGDSTANADSSNLRD
jgi:hypothetical protein